MGGESVVYRSAFEKRINALETTNLHLNNTQQQFRYIFAVRFRLGDRRAYKPLHDADNHVSCLYPSWTNRSGWKDSIPGIYQLLPSKKDDSNDTKIKAGERINNGSIASKSHMKKVRFKCLSWHQLLRQLTSEREFALLKIYAPKNNIR
jgi:hypothetical protein